MFQIKFSKQAEKFLSKCEQELFDRIKKKLEILKENPVLSDAKFIGRNNQGDKVFRIRVGKIRILYEIKETERLIIISKIDKRERVYE